MTENICIEEMMNNVLEMIDKYNSSIIEKPKMSSGFQKIPKPAKEIPERLLCDYFKFNGKICNLPCMKNGENSNKTKCHFHQRRVNVPCKNCGNGTHSKTGYCANLSTGCRYKAMYQTRIMNKILLENKSVNLYTQADETCIPIIQKDD